MQIPNCYYRISVKALVLNEVRDKFLITKEDNGFWELPGGGLEWKQTVLEGLKGEIKEEMGVEVTWMAGHPSYFLVDLSDLDDGRPRANIIYETKLNSLDFTPSNECQEIAFVNKTTAFGYDLHENVKIFVKMFDPERHRVGT